MHDGEGILIAEIAALDLLKRLRLTDARVGIKNSGIAFDVALLFYEVGLQQADGALSVDQIADVTQYSGPTVRLVLKRLISNGTVVSDRRLGKTQFYVLTKAGRAAFHEYIEVLEAFRTGAAPPA